MDNATRAKVFWEALSLMQTGLIWPGNMPSSNIAKEVCQLGLGQMVEGCYTATPDGHAIESEEHLTRWMEESNG